MGFPQRVSPLTRAQPAWAGEARRRGGGTIYAAAVLPPERAGLEGCAALGGRSMMGSPRRGMGHIFYFWFNTP
jgi:hypothetical protein